MRSMSFLIPGTVGLRVTITEQADGTLRFDLQNEGEDVADLRGLFFDTTDAGLLSGLSAVGSDVTDSAFKNDAVVNLGGGVNMNGHGVFDAGVEFGTSGLGKDDIDATSFTLASSRGALELEDFAGVDFGVRFTSVGDPDGARNGSLKLVFESPDAPGDPIILPPDDIDPIIIVIPPAG